MDDVMEKIVVEATEKMDEFYFKTMQPFCEDVLEMKIKKDDLKDALLLWEKEKDRKQVTITQMLEDICQEMCQDFCRYTHMEPPEGKDDNWLTEDDDSPCNRCPLNRL